MFLNVRSKSAENVEDESKINLEATWNTKCDARIRPARNLYRKCYIHYVQNTCFLGSFPQGPRFGIQASQLTAYYVFVVAPHREGHRTN